MARKTGLGSGLESLFADGQDLLTDNKNTSILRITLIESKKTQPRKSFNKESLAELADSIARHGIIQPIVVRTLPSGFYQIIAGERRWRAAKMAGLDDVPVVIKNVDDLTAAEMTMIENLQREDLNPIEEAMGYRHLADRYDLTQEEISKKVAKSRSVIANALRLLSLPKEVIELIEKGDLSTGHARTLLSLDDPESQLRIAERIIKNNLNVRDTEKLVRSVKNSAVTENGDRGGDGNIDIRIGGDVEFEKSDAPEAAEAAAENETADKILEKNLEKNSENLKIIEEQYIKNLQDKVSDILGKKVFINMAKKNGGQNNQNHNQSGKIEIEYKNNDEFESIIKVLCGGNNIFGDL